MTSDVFLAEKRFIIIGLDNFLESIMGAKERLQEVQSVLQKRGVRDVKFCFAPGAASKMPLSDFQNSVADFFDAYLKERQVSLPRVGDAPISA